MHPKSFKCCANKLNRAQVGYTAKCERNMLKLRVLRRMCRKNRAQNVESPLYSWIRLPRIVYKTTLILIKLFNLEPFNSSLWICTSVTIRYAVYIWIMLAPFKQTCRPDIWLCNVYSLNVMLFFLSRPIVFAKCIAKSLTVKGFPLRTFIIIATAQWNLNHLFDWHNRNNNKIYGFLTTQSSWNSIRNVCIVERCERIPRTNTRFVYLK